MDDAADRFPAYYAQFVRSYTRAEWLHAQGTAEAFLRDAEDGGYATEACVARRCLGATRFFQGDLTAARALLERVLADDAPDSEMRFRFNLDTGVQAAAYLAMAVWHLGEAARARQFAEQAIRCAAELGHAPTRAFLYLVVACLDVERDDPRAVLRSAEMAHTLSREHGMAFYAALAGPLAGWARGRLHDSEAGVIELRKGLSDYLDQGNKVIAPLFHGMLAQLEAATRGPDPALMLIERGLAIAAETGERVTDPYLHRLRGEILLRRVPADTARAEEAFQSAIATAKEQGARTYVLLASLSLARLYESTGRPADGHAVLAPALEGFAPTPEMPEIAEAQALLLALAGRDEVKADATRRERRTQLELNMATALLHGRGMQAPETRAAFERAGGFVAAIGDPMERLAILYGQFAGEFARGDVRRMQEIATSMEAISVGDPSSQGALIARRLFGLTQFFAGDLTDADRNMQWASDHYDFDRDHGLAIRFGADQGVGARNYLALTKWLLGDIDAAFRVMGEAKRLAERVGHPPSSAAAYVNAAWLDCMRGDYARGQANAANALAFARDFDLPLWRSGAESLLALTRAASDGTRAAWDEAEAAMVAVSKHLQSGPDACAAYIAAGYAALGDFDRALALVERGLSGPAERGLRVFLPEAHRVRGEILFKRDAGDAVPAEEALRTAITIAREQSSRAFGLRAALSLAKLYQSTDRPTETHAVLAPALEGFSPTPEMPEIAEAQALMERLA
jgi:predicted ATPase